MEYTGVYWSILFLYFLSPNALKKHTDNITLTSDLRVAMGADGSAIPTFQKKVITRIIS